MVQFPGGVRKKVLLQLLLLLCHPFPVVSAPGHPCGRQPSRGSPRWWAGARAGRRYWPSWCLGGGRRVDPGSEWGGGPSAVRRAPRPPALSAPDPQEHSEPAVRDGAHLQRRRGRRRPGRGRGCARRHGLVSGPFLLAVQHRGPRGRPKPVAVPLLPARSPRSPGGEEGEAASQPHLGSGVTWGSGGWSGASRHLQVTASPRGGPGTLSSLCGGGSSQPAWARAETRPFLERTGG